MRGAECVFPSSSPGLRTLSPHLVNWYGVTFRCWLGRGVRSDLEPTRVGFRSVSGGRSLWRAEASVNCFLPSYAATFGPRFTALRSRGCEEGRRWFSLCLLSWHLLVWTKTASQMSVGGSSRPAGTIHCSPHTLTPPQQQQRGGPYPPCLCLPPGDWWPLPHVHLSVLPTPPSVSNCFPSPRECCGFEMMVFNHFLSDQPRNHFLVPYTQIKS